MPYCWKLKGEVVTLKSSANMGCAEGGGCNMFYWEY